MQNSWDEEEMDVGGTNQYLRLDLRPQPQDGTQTQYGWGSQELETS